MKIPKTKEELESLHGHIESRSLEFKGLNPQNNKLPKSEKLLKTIQGIMNGVEENGCIIIGFQESSGELDCNLIQPVSFPCTIQGMDFQPPSFDEYRRHLYNYVRDNTIPYYEGLVSIHKVEIEKGQFIIVIEVNQSSERPHKNSNGHRYIRRDGYTEEMSYVEEEIAMHGKRERLNQTNSLLEETSSPNTPSYKPSIPLNGEPFVRLTPFGNRSHARGVSLIVGPYAFLRLTPNKVQAWNEVDLLKHIREYGLAPLGYFTSIWMERNEGGVVAFQETAHDETKAYNLTQVNSNGSIEGIDTYILNPYLYLSKLDNDIDFSYLPITSVEEIFERAMNNYLRFAEKDLQSELPITFEAEIVGVKDYALAIPQVGCQSPFAGNSVHQNIGYKGVITKYDQPIKEILHPFFEKIWNSFGLQRPSR